MTRPRRIVVGISGASGALYAQRTIEQLVLRNIEVHLVVSPMGQRLLHDELGMEGVDLDVLSGAKIDQFRGTPIQLHHYRDVGSVIASGSFLHDGMVIVPCSSNSLSAVAVGSQNNLMHRAAAVTLKERRKLILVHRETPLGMTDIRNMQLATESGALICPANPGFYLLPSGIDDLINFVVGKILDLLEIEHDLKTRWEDQKIPMAGDDESKSC